MPSRPSDVTHNPAESTHLTSQTNHHSEQSNPYVFPVRVESQVANQGARSTVISRTQVGRIASEANDLVNPRYKLTDARSLER